VDSDPAGVSVERLTPLRPSWRADSKEGAAMSHVVTRDERGASAVEYSLVVVIGIALIARTASPAWC
jgi:hypothetical protein